MLFCENCRSYFRRVWRLAFESGHVAEGPPKITSRYLGKAPLPTAEVITLSKGEKPRTLRQLYEYVLLVRFGSAVEAQGPTTSIKFTSVTYIGSLVTIHCLRTSMMTWSPPSCTRFWKEVFRQRQPTRRVAI